MKTLVHLVPTTLAMLTMAGCATVPGDALGLSVDVEAGGETGKRPAVYRLINESGASVTGCLTNLYGYTFRDHRDLGAYAAVRPVCARAFDLAPGDGLEWAHAINLDDAPHDAKTLRGWATVLVPGGCVDRGCRRIDVRSPSVPVN